MTAKKQRTSKGLLAVTYVKKYPNLNPTQIAKMLFNSYPSEFKDAESARMIVRKVLGKAGEKDRNYQYTDVRKELALLKKELPKGETEKLEPYHLPKSCTRVLVLSDCVPTHSEVLTQNGWVSLKNIQIGTPIMASDSDGNLKFSPILNKVTPRIDDVYTFKRGSVEMAFTENHRHLSYNGKHFSDKTTKQIKDNVYVGLRAHGVKKDGQNLDIRLMKLIGFCLGDGTRDSENWKISISTPRKIDYIDALFDESDMTRNINKRGNGTYANIYRLRVGLTSIIDSYIDKNKNINWEKFMSLNKDCLDAILDGIVSSGGCKKKDRPNVTVCSIKKEHIIFIQTICHLTDKKCIFGKPQSNKNATFKSDKPLYTCTISKNATSAYGGKFLKETKKEEVSCISVEGTYFLMRQNNNIVITGNCHIPYQNDEALFSAIEYGIEKDVNCIYLNGDTIDMYQLSRHEKNPANRSFSYELDTCRTFLKGLRNIFPNAHIVYKIGNHCFEKGTEVLTINGFVDFRDLKEDDLVAQFDTSMNISYSKPNSIIKEHYKGLLYEIENNYSRQSVTDGHRVAVGDDFILAKDLKISDVKNIPLNGFLNKQDYNISDELLRFIVWLVCDGCIVYKKRPISDKIRFQFKISKERKISALRELLEKIKFPYTFKECKKSGINKLQPYYIRMYQKGIVHEIYKMLDGKKKFPFWFRELSKRQVELVINEISITDGTIHDGATTLTTTSYDDASLLQEICILNGMNCNLKSKENKSGFDNGKTQYFLRIRIDSENTNISVKKIETKEYDDLVYCVEMPLGTVVTRKNGKVAFSGNCARYEKYIMQNAPHLLGIDALKLSELLNFTELRIHEVKSMQWAYAGKLPILHGHELPTKSGGVNPARTVQLKLNKQGIVGHFHRETRSNGKQFDDKPYTTYSSGCLCDLNPAYMPINDWTHGFTYIEVDAKNGNYYVQQKTIVDGKIY